MTAPLSAAPPRLRMRVRRVSGAPVVAIRLWAAGGARVEAIAGQAVVAGRMLEEGTRQRDWRGLSDLLEAKGMNLACDGGFEGHGLSLEALATDWEQALDWAAEAFLESTFPEDRCAWVARQAAAELESQRDEPEILTAWGFFDQLYAPHPRHRPLQGDAASLARVRAEESAAFHAASLTRGVIAVVTGLIDEDAVAQRLGDRLKDLQGLAVRSPEPPLPDGSAERRRLVALPASEQAHLYVGHLTVPRCHPDFTALEVLAVILGAGAGLNGRIPERIREREALAYSASAHTVAGASLDAGRLVAYVGTDPAFADQAERGVIEEITRLVEQGVGDDEVISARQYLLGREPFRRETARQWADLLLEATHLGTDSDDPERRAAALNACTRENVERAATEHLRPAELRVTLGRPDAAPD
jgi:zinc protease